jgi:acetolactate synthase small subunit
MRTEGQTGARAHTRVHTPHTHTHTHTHTLTHKHTQTQTQTHTYTLTQTHTHTHTHKHTQTHTQSPRLSVKKRRETDFVETKLLLHFLNSNVCSFSEFCVSSFSASVTDVWVSSIICKWCRRREISDLWEERKILTRGQASGVWGLPNHCNVLGCQKLPSQKTHRDRAQCRNAKVSNPKTIPS